MSREKIIKKLKIKNPNINYPEILETIEVFCDSIKSALKERIREYQDLCEQIYDQKVVIPQFIENCMSLS